MKGIEIILSANPNGKFMEGIINDASKPGTLMEVVPAVAPVGGRMTYRAITRADGVKGPIFILCPDKYQGKLFSDAYVAGTRGFLYAPEMGEEFNMLVGDVAGTADDVAIGDLFGGTQTTGKLKANAGFASAPFQSNEVIIDPIADYWLWVTYLGNQA